MCVSASAHVQVAVQWGMLCADCRPAVRFAGFFIPSLPAVVSFFCCPAPPAGVTKEGVHKLVQEHRAAFIARQLS